MLTAFHHADRFSDASFFRTSDGREIDLLVQTDAGLWAIEIKLTSRPDAADLATLNANADLVGAVRRFLICGRVGTMAAGAAAVCDLDGFVREVEGRPGGPRASS